MPSATQELSSLPQPIARDDWYSRRRMFNLEQASVGRESSSSVASGAWRDRARAASPADLRSGLYPSNAAAPRSAAVTGDSFAVGGGVAIGGVAYSGSYFEPACSSSSSFSFSFFLGGGWGGFGFGFSNGAWCGPPAIGWAPGGGWAPFCGWAWSGRWWGWNSGWCRPWWCPPTWSDPWCAPACWGGWWRPSFSACFGWPAWSTTVVFSPVVFQPPPPPVVVVQPPAVVLASPEQAWSLLAAGFDAQAMADFAALAAAQPGNPGHEVGYALAQAMLGIDESAAIAMRRALRSRAEALLLVPTEPALRERLAMLSERLRDQARVRAGTAAGIDALFMLGAVQAILYQNAEAYFSVNSAIEQGDRDLSSFNLKGLVQARIQQTF